MKHRRFFLAALATLFLPAPASASILDPMAEIAKLCTRQLPRSERKYGIPLHLLSAIASTESGRWHDGLQMRIPWPWTINAEGKGQFFATKQEAVSAVKKLRAQGVQSIDVGCMQVNLRHHPNAFGSLEQAFDPESNVDYAARFLRENYNSEGSWKKAAAAYHSRTPVHGQRYLGLVYNSWYDLIYRLREAKTQVGSATATPESSRSTQQYALRTGASTSGMPAEKKTAGKALPAHRTPTMRVITMSKAEEDRRRKSGIIVYRPEPSQPPEQPAQEIQPSASKTEAKSETQIANAVPATPAAETKPDPWAVSRSAPPEGNISYLRKASATAQVRKNGPRFIFD